MLYSTRFYSDENGFMLSDEFDFATMFDCDGVIESPDGSQLDCELDELIGCASQFESQAEFDSIFD